MALWLGVHADGFGALFLRKPSWDGMNWTPAKADDQLADYLNYSEMRLLGVRKPDVGTLHRIGTQTRLYTTRRIVEPEPKNTRKKKGGRQR